MSTHLQGPIADWHQFTNIPESFAGAIAFQVASKHGLDEIAQAELERRVSSGLNYSPGLVIVVCYKRVNEYPLQDEAFLAGNMLIKSNTAKDFESNPCCVIQLARVEEGCTDN